MFCRKPQNGTNSRKDEHNSTAVNIHEDNINADDKGAALPQTVADIASSANFKEKLEDLLESYGDVNRAMKNGKTLLHYFAANEGGNAANCLKILAETGADLNLQDGHGMTALHYAAHNENQGRYMNNSL